VFDPRAAALCVLLLAAVASPARADDRYFPLHLGNWWAYEEEDANGVRLSRETWTLIGSDAGEFHLRSTTKRLDALGRLGRRWEGHEYLRTDGDGVRKRFPGGPQGETDVLLLKESASSGTRWHDAQGECEVAAEGASCAGPRGDLPSCLVVVCRLGTPPATVVTSTYARGIGMVRQDLDLTEVMPVFEGAPGAMFTDGGPRSGHSVLRLTAFHIDAR